MSGAQRNAKCPVCCQPFGLKEARQNHQPVKWPLLLNCGHAFCETCLNRRAKQELTSICCPTCKILTPLPEGLTSVAHLPIDVYLIGHLFLQRFRHTSTQAGLEFLKPNPDIVSKKDDKPAKKELCGECSIREASCKCLKCECDMCSACFESVHKSSKILRKHQAIPLYDDESLAPIPAVCALHENRPIEYFCENDSISICSHCALFGEHQNHNIQSLEEKNKIAIQELDHAVQTSNTVLRALRKSDRLLSSTLPETRQEMLSFREELQQQFRRLHGELQKRETELLEELGEVLKREVEPLDKWKYELRAQISKVESILKDTDKAMNSTVHLPVNAQQVLARLNAVGNIPCYVKFKRPDTQPLSFGVDEDVVKAFDRVVTMESNPFMKLEVLSLSEAPEDFISEDQDSVSTNSTRVSRCTSWAEQQSEADSEDNNSVLSTLIEASETLREKKKNKKKLFKKRQILRNQHVNVLVTHIKNPCSFMVQHCSDQKELNRLLDRIQTHCKNNTDLPEDIEEGNPVLAQFSADQTWYRARIKNVVVEDANPDTAKVHVIYVDFGNTEVVPVSRLRKITPTFMKMPSLAIHAALVDITSSDESGQWTLDAVHSFAEMTNEKPMLMHVVKETENGQVLVDLCKPIGDDGADNRPVSVRDALVFLEFAIFDASPLCRGLPPRPQRRFISPAPLQLRQQLECTVTHVDSPHSFYLQKGGDDSQFLLSMMTNLQKVYGHDDKQLWSVFYPQLDLVCISQYEADNQWYRAQVVGVPGRCNVDVHYVDFGNTARVSHTKLRCIQQSFLVLPKQAILCSLADVMPVGGAGWPTDALASFSAYCYSPLRAIVREVRDKLAYVVLYTHEGLCINYQLVEDGYAISTGPGSEQPYLTDTSMPQTDNNAKEVTRKITKRESPPVQKQPSTKPVTKPSVSPETEPKDKSNQAKVMYIKNPSHLYVTLLSASDDGLDEFMQELQTIYKDSPVINRTWEVGNDCAAQRKKDGRWYRGRIIETGSAPETFRVLLIDYGYHEDIHVSLLRILQPQSVPAFALQCHLSGVQPAGGTSTWTATATEYLRDITEGKTVYIVPKGEGMDEGSFPLDLLLEKKIEGDALNPEQIEYPSVTDLLMDRGVALPNRRLTRQKSGPIVTIPPKPAETATPTCSGAASETPATKEQPPSNITESAILGESQPEKKTVETECVSAVSEPIASQDTPACKEGIKNSPPMVNGEIETENGLATGDASKPCPDTVMKVQTVKSQSDKADSISAVETDSALNGAGDPGMSSRKRLSMEMLDGVRDSAELDFPPPILPRQDKIIGVPSYVDWDMVIHVQEVKEDEDMEGRYGYFLKEHTLETIIQDEHLRRRGLYRARIPRDGNCLFRAFSQALYSDQGYQGQLRKMVVKYLTDNWDILAECLGEQDRDLYLSKMRSDGQYAGEPEIQAICCDHGISVELCMGGLTHPVQIRCYNADGGAERVVRLIYVSDGNFDSGHYDLAVESLEEVFDIDSVYQLCRKKKIREIKQWPMYRDNTFYDDSLLHQLTDHLNTHYAKSGPDLLANWLVGQSVVAQFSEDDTYYRARITAINNKGIQVQYIDFGNSEYTSADRLRKDIILTEIPQQCFRCILHGISRRHEGKWTKALLDYTHKLIVNKQCEIQIVDRSTSREPVEVRLKMPDGRDLSTVLLEAELVISAGETLGPNEKPHRPNNENATLPPPPAYALPAQDEFGEDYAKPVETETSELSQSDNSPPDYLPERKVPSPYRLQPLPNVGEAFFINIIEVNSPSQVHVCYVSQEEPTEEFREIQNELDQALEMKAIINADARLYPPLKYVKPGAACCCQYYDNKWYRGEILAVERRGVTTFAGVSFIDYGSFRWITSDELRELPEDLMRLRAQSFMCQMAGLAPPPGEEMWSEEATKIAINLYQDMALLAFVISVKPQIEVEVFSVEEYQNMLDDASRLSQPLVEAGLACWMGNVTEDGTVVENEEEDLEDAEQLEKKRRAAKKDKCP